MRFPLFSGRGGRLFAISGKTLGRFRIVGAHGIFDNLRISSAHGLINTAMPVIKFLGGIERTPLPIHEKLGNDPA